MQDLLVECRPGPGELCSLLAGGLGLSGLKPLLLRSGSHWMDTLSTGQDPCQLLLPKPMARLEASFLLESLSFPLATCWPLPESV